MKSKKVGKVSYFNSITGIITYNNDLFPFHLKDCRYLSEGKDLLNKYVEFDIEKNSFGDVARNITLVKKSDKYDINNENKL